MKYKPRSICTLFAFLTLSIFLFSPIAHAEKEIPVEDCLACHDTPDAKQFKSSIHGDNICTSCHNDILEIPHSENPAKVTCSECHVDEDKVYKSSGHGMAVKAGFGAAFCLDCHGDPHTILDSSNPESPVSHQNIPSTCAACHEDTKKMAQFSFLEKKHPSETYFKTIHGAALADDKSTATVIAICTDCHGAHDLYPKNNQKSRIHRENIPRTCGRCHKNILKTYQHGVHGRSVLSGNIDSPVCTDCHGEHTIQSPLNPSSPVYPTAVAEKTCGRCHASEKITSKYKLPPNRLKTYFESYHGLASKHGLTTVANCASCHGAHDILPSKDPNSTVHKNNLPKTCGRCHLNASDRLKEGSIHMSPSPTEDQAVYFVTIFYILLIIVVIGGMLIHNLLDFVPKVREYYRKHKEEGKYLRFTKAERIQHLILSTTFILLAYTGFALRYPDTWWALPLRATTFGFDMRGLLHRAVALVFCGLSIYHVWFLLRTKRGRGQLNALLPRKRDLTDLINMTKYNLGLIKHKPSHERYNYIEKMEYWALVWGSIIMILTGSLLTFESFTMQHFPKWVIDVAVTIHYYEAILAALAIVIWHFYFTIFDLSQYPLNLAMLTGRIPEHERRKKPERKKSKKKNIEKQ